eukprot:CAMPEP_0114354046 /NCGR_PEP_ID=MMETSP0101-20121206/19125_1 /TAXON_ID=38822 ORGANISM="Pteridomonas danica, Strain PT" /NCGR_SAMPLE_ID=MMETSP0101 /ASSEMBLY_ACC=CAM_ASM_000211 /LENGTH=127 /DNA_ID=CAMNT_0001495197 /DNA_START=173 /DNA_END=553 /DNA_ORIENTATION=-
MLNCPLHKDGCKFVSICLNNQVLEQFLSDEEIEEIEEEDKEGEEATTLKTKMKPKEINSEEDNHRDLKASSDSMNGNGSDDHIDNPRFSINQQDNSTARSMRDKARNAAYASFGPSPEEVAAMARDV